MTPKKWVFPLDPVPAARPKVGRYGAYYPARYETFRKAAFKLVRQVVGTEFTPASCAVEVNVLFLRERPKKTERLAPQGDIDNYQKAIFDSLNEVVWADDDQIVEVHARKGWAAPGKPGRIEVTMKEYREKATKKRRADRTTRPPVATGGG